MIKILRCFCCLPLVASSDLVQRWCTSLYSVLASHVTRLERMLRQSRSVTAGLQHSLPSRRRHVKEALEHHSEIIKVFWCLQTRTLYLYLKGNCNYFSSLRVYKSQNTSWPELELDVQVTMESRGWEAPCGRGCLDKTRVIRPCHVPCPALSCRRCWWAKGAHAAMPSICTQGPSLPRLFRTLEP